MGQDEDLSDDAEEAGEVELDEDELETLKESERQGKQSGSLSTKKDAFVKKHDYTEMFPGVFPSENAKPTPTIAKLRGDDLLIMRSLIKKYDSNFDRMFMDISLNYMQWSKGELKKKYKAYQTHHQ